MAKITYRGNTITPGTNVVDYAANTELTNEQIDKNWSSLNTDLGTKAPSASPTFTGTPIVPTATPTTNNTQAASTAFAQRAAADAALAMAIALG